MKIYNEAKTQILTEDQCDLQQGFFNEEYILNEFGIHETVLIYKLYTEEELRKIEIRKIEKWFETEYRETYEKCTRRIALGILMRDGSTPQQVLSNLYNQAEINANRINQLKQF